MTPKSTQNWIAKVLSHITYVYWQVIYNSFREKYSISPEFSFNGKDILLYGDGDIHFGANSYIGDRSTVQASKGYSVSIGASCHIASNVRVFTDSAIADSNFLVKPVPVERRNVKIGDGCWIGANVLVNPGSVIGENSVVGANSVVTKSIPPGEIWGGVPARFIRKKRTNKDDNTILANALEDALS
jgi:maltose O-acetyltransferase